MSYQSEVLADSPLWLALLDDATATIADSSGNGHSGTYTNSPTLGAGALVVTEPGTAVTFDGATQFGQVAGAAWMDVADYSVEFWIKTTANNAYVICRDDGSVVIWSVFVRVAGTIAYVTQTSGGSNVQLNGTVTVNDGNPHHVVVTKSGTTMTTYVDGTLDVSTTSATFKTSTTQAIDIARRPPGGSFLSGTLDDLAFYGSALSPARVLSHFQAGILSLDFYQWLQRPPGYLSPAVARPNPLGDASVAPAATPASITGDIAALVLAAPAGTVSTQANVSLTGVVSPLALAAPAGTVATSSNVALTGPTAALTIAPPTGVVAMTVAMTGAVSPLTLAAPAGTVATQKNVALTGAVSPLTLAAPAGTVTTTSNAALTGAVAPITLNAPGGTVATGGSVSLTGAVAPIVIAAPAGTVTTQRQVALTGVTAALTLTAPAGSVSASVTISGPVSTLELSALAGQVSLGTVLTLADVDVWLTVAALPRTSAVRPLPRTVDAAALKRTAAVDALARTAAAATYPRTVEER